MEAEGAAQEEQLGSQQVISTALGHNRCDCTLVAAGASGEVPVISVCVSGSVREHG